AFDEHEPARARRVMECTREHPELGRTPDEDVVRRPQPRGSCNGARRSPVDVASGAGHAVELWLLTEDLAFELPQRRARLDSELLYEDRTHFLVAAECFGLAPAPVQREQQQLPPALTQRMLVHERLQIGDDLLVPTERELGFGMFGDRDQAQLLEPAQLWKGF